MARETGEDHRAVSRAYHELAADGLVEVRGRSGVYMGGSSLPFAGSPSSETKWIAELLAGARRRRLALPELSAALCRLVEEQPPCCVLLESSEDMLAAYGHELRSGYGMRVVPVDGDELARSPDDPALLAAFGGADLVATTLYHIRRAAPMAERFGIPLVTLTVDPEAARDVATLVRRRLREGPLTVVLADRRFALRLQAMYPGVVGEEDEIRYLLADEAAALARLPGDERVVLTRAAAERLGDQAPPVFLSHAPLLSPETIRQLCLQLAGFAFRERRSLPDDPSPPPRSSFS
jgi:hypothetical protein